MHQSYGPESKSSLADKVFQKEVKVEWQNKDSQQQILGQVFLDEHWINKEQVYDGWAWHDRETSDSKMLLFAENDARTNKRGLWAGSHPIPPSEFRQLAANENKAKPEKKSSLKNTAPSKSRPDQNANQSETSNDPIVIPSPSHAGRQTYIGPRGGIYHYSESGKKVYERKKH